ncbi:hypothetical protein [Caenispirillum salinarum]|uniref:hypothetical protein n=1 Tax=Caenispirillum salinarum TaxID=859058 RepID=UPI0005B778F9|nr:hypothetical protein [Caenispirillum salinarum]
MAEIIYLEGSGKRAELPENLFLRFMCLEPTRKSFQGFANLYGTLDCGVEEPVSAWQSEREAFRKAVFLWQFIEGTTGIPAREDEDILGMFPDLFDALEDEVVDAGVLALELFPKAGWTVEALGAHSMLHGIVSDRLRDRMEANLVSDFDRLSLRAEPFSVCTAGKMWLQLTNAVNEKWKLRKCHWCRTPFRLKDPRAMYCSPSCKTSAIRARRAKK